MMKGDTVQKLLENQARYLKDHPDKKMWRNIPRLSNRKPKPRLRERLTLFRFLWKWKRRGYRIWKAWWIRNYLYRSYVIRIIRPYYPTKIICDLMSVESMSKPKEPIGCACGNLDDPPNLHLPADPVVSTQVFNNCSDIVEILKRPFKKEGNNDGKKNI